MSTQIPKPDGNDPTESWKDYWKAQGQSWRTDAEISIKRQEELAQCRTILTNVEQSIYPFKEKLLSRADVEWLLATHENGRVSIDRNDEKQRGHNGMDLRYANLRGINVSGLPLTGTHLEGADLSGAHLEKADLSGAHLEGAVLCDAHLEGTNLYLAHLEAKMISPDPNDMNWQTVYGLIPSIRKISRILRPTDLRRAFFDSTTMVAHFVKTQKPAGIRATFLLFRCAEFSMDDVYTL